MYAGVLAWALARGRGLDGVVWTLGLVGAALLVLALWREGEEPVPWALGALGLAYAVTLFKHGGHVDEGAPLVATGLLLCGELAAWSLDARGRIRADEAVLRRRVTALGVLLLSGLAASSAVVLVAGAPTGHGLAWTTIGAVAAVAAVAVSVVLLRRASRSIG